MPTEIIVSGRDAIDVLTEIESVLIEDAAVGPYFSRGDALVRLWQCRSSKRVRLGLVSLPELDQQVAEKCRFRTTGKAGPKPSTVSERLIRQLRARHDNWTFELRGVCETPPIWRGANSALKVITERGFDLDSGWYFAPSPSTTHLQINRKPSASQVQTAIEVINRHLVDFPFADEASRANFHALVLSVLMRPAIDGPVPMAVVDSPTKGTGKSLLVDLLSIIVSGRPAATLSPPATDDETRKAITAQLMEGERLIAFDNVSTLKSPVLEQILTARRVRDRVLGASKMVEVPQEAVFIATGNNVQIHGDLERRCFLIRLDARTEAPWKRSGFAIPDPRGFVLEHRCRIVEAYLTLVTHWIQLREPRPDLAVRLGSFEGWCEGVGGVLSCSGVGGFLENLAEIEARDDADHNWRAALESLAELFSETEWRATDAASLIADYLSGESESPELVERLLGHLPEEVSLAARRTPRSLTVSLGRALSPVVGRVFGGYRLARRNAGGSVYFVERAPAAREGSEGSGASDVS